MDTIAVVILCVISAISALSPALTGLGDSIIFQALWSVAGEFGDLAALGVSDLKISGRILIWVNLACVIPLAVMPSCHRHAVPRITGGLVAGIYPTIVLGLWLLLEISNLILQQILGGIFLFFVVWRFAQIFKDHLQKLQTKEKTPLLNPVRQDKTELEWGKLSYKEKMSDLANDYRVWWAVFAGLFSGLFKGMFSVGGPPMIIYFALIHSLTKEEMRAIGVMREVLEGPVRIATGFYFEIFRVDEIPIYAFTCICTVVGTYIGHKLHLRVNKEMTLMMMLVLMYLASIPLTNAGVGSLQNIIMMVVIVCVAIFVLFGTCYVWNKQRISKLMDSTPVDTVNTRDVESITFKRQEHDPV